MYMKVFYVILTIKNKVHTNKQYNIEDACYVHRNYTILSYYFLFVYVTVIVIKESCL